MPDIQDMKANDPFELKAVEVGQKIAQAYMVNAIETWERTDKLSTWALGAAGAAVALVVSQQSQMQEQFGARAAHALLWSLAVSVLAGITQRFGERLLVA